MRVWVWMCRVWVSGCGCVYVDVDVCICRGAGGGMTGVLVYVTFTLFSPSIEKNTVLFFALLFPFLLCYFPPSLSDKLKRALLSHLAACINSVSFNKPSDVRGGQVWTAIFLSAAGLHLDV